MANPDPLRDAKLKVKWADGYITELATEIETFRRSNPYKVFEEIDPQTGNKLIRVRLIDEVPTDIQRLVGNIVTDLRTALDYLACQLVILNKGDPAGVEFPIARSVGDFETAITKGKIKKASPSAIFEISRMEPYKGGKSSGLWALNQLRRKEMHRHLTPISHAVGLDGPMNIRAGETGSVTLSLPIWSAPDECPVVLTVSGDDNHYQVNCAIDISVADIEGFEREPLLPFLQQSSEFIGMILSKLERRFFMPPFRF